MIRKNENFPSMDSLHSLDFEKVCEIKQGYVLKYLRTTSYKNNKEKNINEYDDNESNDGKIIEMQPVFAVINKETMSFYENENINSLINSYILSELITRQIDSSKREKNGSLIDDLGMQKNMFCIQLIENSQVQDRICLDSKESCDDWQKAIHNFNKCSQDQVKSEKEFKEKVKKVKQVQQQEDVFVKLKTKSRNQRDTIDKQNRNDLKKILEIQNKKRNKFLQNTLVKYKQQLEQLTQEEQDFQKQHNKDVQERQDQQNKLNCLEEQIYEDRMQGENQDELLTMSEVTKEEEKVEKQLIEEMTNEQKEKEKKIKELNEIRKEGETNEKQEIEKWGIKQIQQGYSGSVQECYTSEISEEKYREVFIEDKCKQIAASKSYDIIKGRIIQMLSKCMENDNFCDYCCNYNVGVNYIKKVNSCIDKCQNALNGQPNPEMKIKLQLTDTNRNSIVKNNKIL